MRTKARLQVAPFSFEGKMAEMTGLEQELAQLIRQSAPEIVRKVIGKAQEGSYLHAKFLFEFAGLDPARPADEEEGGSDNESLAAYLLRELKEPGAGNQGSS